MDTIGPPTPRDEAPQPRFVPSWFSVPVTVILAATAVASLFLLHNYANERHEAELTLLRLAEASTQHGQLQWKVLAEERYDDSLDAEHTSVELKIDAAQLKLGRLLGQDDTRLGLVAERYDAYNWSITDVFSLVKQGRIAEATAQDQAYVQPRFGELQNTLQLSLGSLRGDARRADQTSLIGTLASVGLLMALLLYWRHERQRHALKLITAEQRGLRRSEARFRRLVQGSSDVVMVIDADGRISSISPSVEQVFGYEPDALQGLPLRNQIGAEDQPLIDTLLANARQGTWNVDTVAFRLASPSGAWFHVESAATNLLSDPDVTGIVLNCRDVTERRTLEQQLAHRAFHDPLTGLANRTLFAERVDHAIVRAVRRPEVLGVIFVDVDDFKLVNDSMGHSVGDELLIAVAQRVQAALRPEDTACRMGGDEFAVLLEDVTDDASVREVARRLLDAICVPFELNGRKIVLSASAGVAIGDGSDTPETVLRNADLAMYSAKGRGKGRIAVYEPDMHKRVVSRLELKAGLQPALDAGEFYLDYQPIVALANQEMVGVEALIRWRHPRRGIVSPLDFIPLAEETGFIVRLGKFVVREACRQAAEWLRDSEDETFHVSVNLSPRQLEHARIVDEVAEALADANLPPSRLVLEITESTLAGPCAEVLDRLMQLRALGVRLAVDDFGTGYSSLFALQNFPIDILKIDKAFVDTLGQGTASGSLTEAILGLAEVLRVHAIAEGIEDVDQLVELRNLNCELGQGFLFARPSSPAEVGRMLRATSKAR